MLLTLYHEILYRPLFNALIFLYTHIPGQDLGIAIIALTVLVRLLMWPLFARQFRSQQAMARLQPKMQEIRNSIKDRQEQSKKLIELYKKEGVNPASGCLPLIVQLPVLIALYQVFINGMQPDSLSVLYQGVPRPDEINPIAFGTINLSEPNVFLGIAAGIFQFFQSKLLLPRSQPSSQKGDFASMMNTQILYVMPVMTVIIAMYFPAGLALYWVTTTILGIIQQILMKKLYETPSSNT